MQVILWDNFSKKHNSTKIPQIAGTRKNMYMKEATSIENPTFMVQSNNFNYTYAYWNGHYYFVNDIVSVKDNLIEISCSQDVLATYREEILDTTQYIARSASAYDGEVIDTLYNGIAEVIRKEVVIPTPFSPIVSQGSYVLGVVTKGTGAGTYGCITYYVLTDIQMRDFISYMLGNIDYMSIDFEAVQDWTEQIFKGLINPFQYIVSCMYFPFKVAGTGATKISFGFWDTNIDAQYLSVATYTDVQSCNIPKHPQAGNRGKYLNLSPYTDYMLNLPPFGCVPLSTKSILESGSLMFQYYIDLLTGKGSVQVSTENSETDIMLLECNVGVPIQLAQVTVGMLGWSALNVTTATAVSQIPSILVGNLEVFNIGNSTSSYAPKVTTGGSQGSRSEYYLNCRLVAEFTKVAPENISINGRPLLQNRQLRTLSGYTQCINPSIDINCLGNDRAEINSMLSNGFYIE